MTNAQAILSVENVVVSFDGFVVLNSLNFSMEARELRFLIGPNGAGKTTLLDVVTGRVKPASGRVVFDGHDLKGKAEHDRARLGIGRKFQTPTVFPSLTVAQNLDVTLGCAAGDRAFFRKLRPSEQDKVHATLTLVGLAAKADQRAGGLSHGETQWLEIGMLLVQDPKLLLLDEPIAGMTRPERDKTGQLMESLSSHSILVVEHDMEFMRQFARHVTVMHLGQVISEGTVEQVQEDPKVREIYLGPRKEEKVAA
jgi:urea transport system ATP-binding protein